MREIYRILAGEHKGKYCYIVNRLSNSFRVCIGEGSDEERYLKVPYSYVDESVPMLSAEVIQLLNEKQLEGMERVRSDIREISKGLADLPQREGN